jgi:hypothetical protein
MRSMSLQLAQLSGHADPGLRMSFTFWRGPEGYRRVANKRKTRRWALVAFGAETNRPTIVCMSEDALPAAPGRDWLIIVRDSDIVPTALPAPTTGRRESNPTDQ